LYRLARPTNSKFEPNDIVNNEDYAITLNQQEYGILKMMMIDYLNNNFNK
jgi:hypothetical protein